MTKAIWDYPRGYNFGEAEGRQAFLDGVLFEDCQYGETLHGKDWKRGWILASTK